MYRSTIRRMIFPLTIASLGGVDDRISIRAGINIKRKMTASAQDGEQLNVMI